MILDQFIDKSTCALHYNSFEMARVVLHNLIKDMQCLQILQLESLGFLFSC